MGAGTICDGLLHSGLCRGTMSFGLHWHSTNAVHMLVDALDEGLLRMTETKCIVDVSELLVRHNAHRCSVHEFEYDCGWCVCEARMHLIQTCFNQIRERMRDRGRSNAPVHMTWYIRISTSHQ